MCFTWDAVSGRKKQRFQLDAGGRGVAAIAMSNCGNYVAMVDKSNDHNVYCFDANSGELKFREKGDANNIFDISFTQQSGQTSFATAGQKHIKFWEVDGTGRKAFTELSA